MKLQNVPGKAKRALRYEVHAHWRGQPVRPDTILYEAFAGSGVLDNPEALFREVLAAPDLQHFRHVWVLNDQSPKHPARVEFAGDKRVTFVRRGTPGYFRALATSKYLINNATFPPEFGKRPEQVYLNTWHGTPLKTMGYDMPGGSLEAANTLRNFVSADYLLSQNSFMTEQMYKRAYRLDGHYRGRIVEEGYPRVDRQSLTQDERLRALGRIESSGVSIGRRRLVLYAPTWKGDTFNDPRDDVATLIAHVNALQAELGHDYVVLLKTHQIVERFTRHDPELRRHVVPNDIPTNVVLGAADVLVTDYSSIFFDYLATGRPVVFFTPDADDYGQARGTYFTDDELPGPVCTSVPELAGAILRPDDRADAERRSAQRATWQKRFASDAVGTSSSRIVDLLFRDGEARHRVLDVSASDRTSILIHLGALWSNGITSSALNLLEAIPSDRYDVTVVYNKTASQQLAANQRRIHASVRQFPREGGMNGHKAQQLRRRVVERRQQTRSHFDDPQQSRLWDDEWARVFGSSRFDHVIDFSGYSPFWATLMLHAPDAHTSMWLHNDMVAEVNRLVSGKPRMRRSLPAVYALYEQYDSLVAVSKSLADINSRRLTQYTSRRLPVAAAHNMVDPARDEARADVPLLSTEFPLIDGEDLGIPEWATRLDSKGDTVWFVTVGRFSQEKNQARMIRAFAEVHREDPRARLLLIGHGSLRSELDGLVATLGLGDVAFVVGPLGNPLPAVKAADCFVLSSLYEGQPMVLLEAAALGLPIVSVDFETVHDALPERSLPHGGIHVVDQDDAALAEGLRAFLRGDVPPLSFDPRGYNVEALGEFFTATGIAAATDRATTDLRA